MKDKLNELGAQDIREAFLRDNSGKEQSGKNSDKMRFTFILKDQKAALDCYQYFIDRTHRMYN